MNLKKKCKEGALLLSPFLLFVLTVVPYSWFNQAYVVKWFGCGCPKLDGNGNLLESQFNANDFTLLFWLAISVCTAVSAVIFSKWLVKNKPWLRTLYVGAVLVVSILFSYGLSRLMLWD